MNINFEYKDVSASKRLEGLAEEKLNKLDVKKDFIYGSIHTSPTRVLIGNRTQ